MRDIEFVNQLATKLCHELTGPIGAVNQGLESYEADIAKIVDPSLMLTKTTAKTAQDRVLFFRIAYGVAKSEANISLMSVHNIANNYLSDFDMQLKLDPTEVSKVVFNTYGIKIFLCLIWLCSKVLWKGGEVSLKVSEESGKKKIIISCKSEKISPEMLKLDVLEGRKRTISDTPEAHSYYTRRLLDDIGAELRVDATSEKLEFIVTMIPV
jgi:histidine phosphotransferase ChpT